MKRSIVIIILLISFILSSCEDVSEAVESGLPSETESSNVEESVSIFENSTGKITSLDYTNKGKMGDTDGPAFAVYSKVGYNGASVELNLAESEIKTRLSDGRFINGYSFLGIDVYEGNYWINCVDAGLCWSGENGGWHLFYNIYETLNETTASWYESSKILPKNGQYSMEFSIIEDNYALLTVKSINGNFKDSVKVEVKGAKANGSNTAFLFNVALDYPPNTKLDQKGNPSEDWVEITLSNTNKGLCFKNLHATNLKLSKNSAFEDWTEDKNSAVSIWPDKAIEGFDYSPTEVFLFDGKEYYINLDMNH